jgi:gluconolactonase
MRHVAALFALLSACAAPQESAPPASAPVPAASGEAPAPNALGLLSGICKETRYRAPTLGGKAVRKLADGYFFVEGPVWIAASSSLLFSEMQPGNGPDGVMASHIRRWSVSGADTFLENGGSNGLALGVDGRLYAATHDQQALSAYDLTSKARAIVAERIGDKHFNSPNDLAVRSDGTVYFTDPDWQKGNRPNETGMTGVYRVAPGGAVTLVDGGLDKPNGIALSPDETTLYVAAFDGKLYRYAVNPDGSTSAGTAFAELPVPDGMTVDCSGNLYGTAHNLGAIVVYAPDGRELGRISVAPKLTNVAFGGSDHQTLFATAGTALYAVDLDVPGLPY